MEPATPETIESTLSFSNPVATSYPSKVTPSREDLPLMILVLNCQSTKSPGKPAQLMTVIESTQADIVIGSESWLDPSISSSSTKFLLASGMTEVERVVSFFCLSQTSSLT